MATPIAVVTALPQSFAASALPQLVTLGSVGSFDADGFAITGYQWTLLYAPPGSAAALSSAVVAAPTFTADVIGSYLFFLVVTSTDPDPTSDQSEIVARSAPSSAFVSVTAETANYDWHIPASGERNWADHLYEIFTELDVAIGQTNLVQGSSTFGGDVGATTMLSPRTLTVEGITWLDQAVGTGSVGNPLRIAGQTGSDASGAIAGTIGGLARVRAGDGGSADATNAGGTSAAGALASVVAGTGGDGEDGANPHAAATGGGLDLFSGPGGAGDATQGGASGAVNIASSPAGVIAGAAGVWQAAGAPSGQVLIRSGVPGDGVNGGTGVGVANGGASGGVALNSRDGGAGDAGAAGSSGRGGASGGVSVYTGDAGAGASDGVVNVTGANAGALVIGGGDGADGAGPAAAGGSGATIAITAGDAGDRTGAGAAGSPGHVYVQAGDGGAGGVGGNVRIRGGQIGTGTATGDIVVGDTQTTSVLIGKAAATHSRYFELEGSFWIDGARGTTNYIQTLNGTLAAGDPGDFTILLGDGDNSDGVTGAQSGGLHLVWSGDGGDGAVGHNAGQGASQSYQTGRGGDATVVTVNSGQGGDFIWVSGGGGDGGAATATARDAGDWLSTLGTGGNGSTAADGGQGGSYDFISGFGGLNSSGLNGGLGGDFTFTARKGGDASAGNGDGGKGGSFSFVGGAGGTGFGAGVGGDAGDIYITCLAAGATPTPGTYGQIKIGHQSTRLTTIGSGGDAGHDARILVDGGLETRTEDIAITSTIDASTTVVFATAGGITLSIPAEMVQAGRHLIIKDRNGAAAGANILINTVGAELIQMGTSSLAAGVTLSINFQVLHLVCDGTHWYDVNG